MKKRVQGLFSFLKSSPTPGQVVQSSKSLLEAAGFVALGERTTWKLKRGGAYLVERGGSLIAFRLAGKAEEGFRILGAHTDSPGLKVKPRGDLKKSGHWSLSVEVYGGVLQSSWFDRDLSLAGQVAYLDNQGKAQLALVDFKRPLAIIPNLAIHLRPKANEGWKIEPQKELSPLLGLDKKGSLKELLLKELGPDAKTLLDFDMLLYPTEPATLVGVEEEFISGARLDNLASCFLNIEALIASKSNKNQLIVLNDHEEVGSGSAVGAGGNFLESVLSRILPEPEARAQVLADSWFCSLDNAHALHPNHPEMHDPEHAPLLGGGPVIKSNAGQSYITDAQASGFFQKLCLQNKIPYQHFAVRSDLRCGSTIGPLTARQLGLKGLDLGLPSLAMHSIRETIAVADLDHMAAALKAWLAED
ncbi:MAG: M18 family aminopeptidase [Candidatus Lambdaproteobacteria bacterium RIFOXYD2_FULL_50_16]|uniref:M18 family aminopeptidase n=1 Tax=Candidatus Lambdaproteobacteria bacterium RIFOXYD2_FULL_50_16 TaxID=1817772 RepID=A0A1F6GB07_9PROT|nr:MAG: M18 family aminopeptidase [Candidatus Lambdaproteobacteria bacterium RIFOXYD2_FULL_50_16]